MSPIGRYFKGKGEQVMSDMQQTYKDPDKAKQVFYATANKNPEMKPAEDRSKKRKTVGQRLAALAKSS